MKKRGLKGGGVAILTVCKVVWEVEHQVLPVRRPLVISAFGKSAQDAGGKYRRWGERKKKKGNGEEEEEERTVKNRKPGGRKNSEVQREEELTT